MSDFASEAFEIAVSTTLEAITIEQENEKMRAEFRRNMERLEDMRFVASQAASMQKKVDKKEALIEQWQREIIEAQKAILKLRKIPKEARIDTSDPTLKSVPIIMRRVQTFVMGLSENAVTEKQNSVPILLVVKVVDAVGKLFNTLTDANIIQESREDNQRRMCRHLQKQQAILGHLKRIVHEAEAAEMEEEEEEEEEEEQADVRSDGGK